MISHIKPILLALSIMGGLDILVCYEYYVLGNQSISDEGAFIESITAITFLFTSVSLIFQSVYKSRLELLSTLFFATTCSLLFIRESNLDRMDIPYFIQFFSDGIGRAALFCSLYLILISLAVIRYKAYKASVLLSYLKSPVTQLTLIGCAFIVAGSLLEEFKLEFLEEVFEMNGSLIIFLSAMIHHKEPIYKEPTTGSQCLVS